MITQSVSANHLELVSEDPHELSRIARFFKVDVTAICKVSVQFIREDLTDESCYKNFEDRQRALAIEVGQQRELEF